MCFLSLRSPWLRQPRWGDNGDQWWWRSSAELCCSGQPFSWIYLDLLKPPGGSWSTSFEGDNLGPGSLYMHRIQYPREKEQRIYHQAQIQRWEKYKCCKKVVKNRIAMTAQQESQYVDMLKWWKWSIVCGHSLKMNGSNSWITQILSNGMGGVWLSYRTNRYSYKKKRRSTHFLIQQNKIAHSSTFILFFFHQTSQI